MGELYSLQTNILLQADDFAEAYRRCVRCENPTIDEYGRTCYSVVNIPAIVNAAFACELYMKSMITTPIVGHKLAYLFSKIDLTKQERIRQYVNNKFKEHPVYSFDRCLERATNVFVNWRYIFEKQHSDGYMGSYINENLMFFEHFIHALKELAHTTN